MEMNMDNEYEYLIVVPPPFSTPQGAVAIRAIRALRDVISQIVG